MRTEMNKYDTNAGSPYDRGSGDYYYGRGRAPHYYPNGTGHAPRVKVEDMTQAELDAYHAGYEQETDQKQWF